MQSQFAVRAAFAVAVGFTLAGCADAPLGGGPRDVERSRPIAIQLSPEAGREILRIHAKGVQIYRAEVDAGGKLAWTFVGPRADLFDNADRKVGTHFKGAAGPVWEIDGQRITGKKLREWPSGNAGAIPQLLLAATVSGGAGPLADTAFVARVETSGGTAPPLDGTEHAGDVREMPYTADYSFHAASP